MIKPSALKNIYQGKVVIVGVGNILRGDDGFGPALIERINGKVKAVCLDSGSALENFAGKILKENPDTVLIVDALHLERDAGEYALLSKDELLKCGLGTHDISFHMFFEYLQKQKPNIALYVLGVQPQTLELGAAMSGQVKKTLGEIAALIIEVDHA
ncbi:MAG: hydrogenase maturation protease [Candidatus Omnitrophota bacterium]